MNRTQTTSWKESSGISSIPVLQIRKNSMVMYHEPLGMRHRRNNRKTWQKQDLSKTAYSGRVTAGVKKRLTKAIEIMLQANKPTWIYNEVTGRTQYHQMSFITLKIPGENINAREAYRNCLSHFLDWLTRTEKVKQFIWKIEPEKRGQVHYHLTTPSFIHYKKIRSVWNSILHKGGYLDEYAKQHGHFDPNSTDIHEVNNVENLSRYLVKALCEGIDEAEKIKKERGKVKPGHNNIGGEMAKDNENFKADSKVWGCCELLTNSKYVTICLESRHLEKIEQLRLQGKVRVVSDETGYWCVFYFSDAGPPDVLNDQELLYQFQMLTWQMKNPGKNATPQQLADWSTIKPFFN